MERVTLRLPEQQIEDCEKLVKAGKYPNRSEAIRAAVRDLLRKEMPDVRRRVAPDGGRDHAYRPALTEPRWFRDHREGR